MGIRHNQGFKNFINDASAYWENPSRNCELTEKWDAYIQCGEGLELKGHSF